MQTPQKGTIQSIYFKNHPFVANRMKGVIKSLTEKGFGFIAPEGQDKDVFFHSSALIDVAFDALQMGETVEFDVEQSEKGPRAVNVRVVAA